MESSTFGAGMLAPRFEITLSSLVSSSASHAKDYQQEVVTQDLGPDVTRLRLYAPKGFEWLEYAQISSDSPRKRLRPAAFVGVNSLKSFRMALNWVEELIFDAEIGLDDLDRPPNHLH